MAIIGQIALVLALITSAYSAIIFALGGNGKEPKLLGSARTALLTVAGLVTISTLVLLFAIFTHDFRLEYVASYTSLNTAPVYLLSALWAGNSGSLLFWAWLLSLFSLAVTLRKPGGGRELKPYASMVLMAAETFFLLLLVTVAPPFNQFSTPPLDGQGLNPMLENMGMVFHPPVLLAGYVAFTVPFAFAISALLTGKTRGEWLTDIRRWMLLAWLLLGIGNIIGAWWAYAELGWGGYWAWDPVENAGLMPWLTATAFLHSSIIQRQRGIFKVWNMILMIMTFCLVIFGTFLTRSGILSSVHTFNDTGMTPFFIVFLGITLLGSLMLLYYRYDDLKTEEEPETIVSREGTFLLNNFLFVGSALVILVGTVFPSVFQAVRGVKVSLNASFFNKIASPLFMAIVLLAGICTVIGWKRSSFKNLFRDTLWPLVISILLVIILLITVTRNLLALLAFLVCSFVLLSTMIEWAKEVGVRHRATGDSYFKAWWNLLRSNRQRYGGYIVHIGIVLIAAGVVGSSFYGVEKDVTLKTGESMTIQKYTVTYEGMDLRETPDKEIVSARLSIQNAGKPAGNLVSEKYFHKSQEQPVTEVGIRSSISDDLYIILESWQNSGATADFKVLVNPLVAWLWIGGAISLIGGLVAFSQGKRGLNDKTVSGEVEEVPKQIMRSVSPIKGKSPSKRRDTDEEIERMVLQKRQEKGQLCPKCGARNRANSRFCSHCGANLSKRKKNV